MQGSVFIATSLDGFIARPDGALDWLPGGESGGAEAEDHGYDTFIASVDGLLMGRATFDVVLGFGSWPFGELPVIVLSSRELDRPDHVPPTVEREEGSPDEIWQRLQARGFRDLYVDGGRTIQAFLRAGRIHRMVITRIPVLLGSGIPLFGPLDTDVRLRHVETRNFRSGLVQSAYEVLRPLSTS